MGQYNVEARIREVIDRIEALPKTERSKWAKGTGILKDLLSQGLLPDRINAGKVEAGLGLAENYYSKLKSFMDNLEGGTELRAIPYDKTIKQTLERDFNPVERSITRRVLKTLWDLNGLKTVGEVRTLTDEQVEMLKYISSPSKKILDSMRGIDPSLPLSTD